ncbi:helix-turn-helix domain-containing protein [Maribacter algarum]|uniref:Helix-turn-helix domain-containing protein n=1 Tax=Maribacter algarum (ex Zhang et al. 2020) TaxID=2578118 RepID=A0A5S3PR32_9FLAO|nr:helix-turn-helix domain-containing protein [Maribacter algarum]TMM57206.1 helix-turn-helix domain-containing protein [Maribacter algarum]
MVPPILTNKKYVLRIFLIVTLVVILVDFAFLNLGMDGLLSWKLHLITALYSFAITLANLAYFDFINAKFNEKTEPYKRISIGVVGSTLITLATYFICRLIHLVLIVETKTLKEFLENETIGHYLFPLFIALVVSLFIQSIFFIKAFQTNQKVNMKQTNFRQSFKIEAADANNEFLKRLQNLLEEEKYYQNTDLDLDGLSKQLETSKRRTSILIQELYGKSFSECINDFRLEEVLYRFKNQKHKKLTIIALALEAGFPSKSTFYRHFKLKIGISPSEFLNRMDGNKFEP